MKPSALPEWRERFLLGAANVLRARPKDEEALKDEQIKKLKQKVGVRPGVRVNEALVTRMPALIQLHPTLRVDRMKPADLPA